MFSVPLTSVTVGDVEPIPRRHVNSRPWLKALARKLSCVDVVVVANKLVSNIPVS